MSADLGDWCSFLISLTNRHFANNHEFLECTFQKKVAVCYKNEDIRQALLDWLYRFLTNHPRVIKSSEKSQELRNRGNEKFRKGDDEASLKFYSDSIIYAPHASSELSLAHGNRSAVLFRLNEFESCIEDVDLAVKTFQRNSIYVKLMMRKGKALLKLKQRTESANCFNFIKQHVLDADLSDKEKSKLLEEIEVNMSLIEDIKNAEDIPVQKSSCPSVSKGKNEFIPFASRLLELEKNETSLCRRVIASKDIEIGDTLIVERPFSCVILPDYSKSHCQYCCRQLRFPIACSECVDYLFCSEVCRSEAFDLFHKWECRGVPLLQHLGVGHLALKTTLIATKNPHSKAYHQVKDLVSHLNEVPSIDLAQYALTATLLVLYLEKYTNYFTIAPSANSIVETGFIILKHLIQVTCNAFAIKKLLSAGSDFASLDFSTVTYATGIYPSAALLNHSCDANIITSFFNNVLVVRARERIKKGEEIFNCYGPNFRKMKTRERREILRNQFFFDCKCKRCVQLESDVDDFNLYLCPKCHSSLSLEECKRAAVKCNQCQTFTKIRYYQNLLQKYNLLREKGEQQISSATSYEAAQMLLARKNCLSFFMDYNNAELVDCKFDYADCCFAIGDYRNWWKYYVECMLVMKRRYGELSIEYLETMKRLIENYLGCTQTHEVVENSVILSYVNEMMKIIELNFGYWSPEYSIVAHIKEELTNSLRQHLEE